MPRLMKKVSRKAGLTPGSLIHIGEKKLERARIRAINYDEQRFREEELKTIEESLPLKEAPGVTWINVDGLHQVEVLEKIGAYFALHPLVLEDILNTEQRPKMEDYGDYIYVVLKMIHYDDKKNEIEAEQVSLILGPTFVLSFQERAGDLFDPVRERIRGSGGRIRKVGPDYLCYSLADAIVDGYFAVLEKLGEQIEAAERELVTHPSPKTLRLIHGLRREMILLRKSIWPLREVIGGLQREDSPLIADATRVYLGDVHDHTVRVIETLESYRDMLSAMLDIYLSSMSIKLNEVMKALTLIATIFIPLTFVAGVYGMNFKYMPELEWRWGYFMAWLVMIAMATSLYAYFKRKKWL